MAVRYGDRKFRRPTGCKPIAIDPEDHGNRQLAVPPFVLHELPVTNTIYKTCVTLGACTPPDHDIADPDPKGWDDPARAELPVYARHDQAEDFCRWAHGRLPSVAELARAAQGEAAIPGVAALTEAAISCFADGAAGSDEICGVLDRMNYWKSPPTPLYRVNAVEQDHGPDGHADLFGSVWEWTRTNGGTGDANFCALADGSPDYVTFDPTSDVWAVVGFASPIIDGLRTHRANAVRVESGGTNRYNLGFRCAFDRMPR